MHNRRQFPRLNATVFARPSRPRERAADPSRVVNISIGGICMFTDDKHSVGERLTLDVVLPGAHVVNVVAKVVWVDTLGKDAPAKFEIGAEFTRIAEEDALRLKALLSD